MCSRSGRAVFGCGGSSSGRRCPMSMQSVSSPETISPLRTAGSPGWAASRWSPITAAFGVSRCAPMSSWAQRPRGCISAVTMECRAWWGTLSSRGPSIMVYGARGGQRHDHPLLLGNGDRRRLAAALGSGDEGDGRGKRDQALGNPAHGRMASAWSTSRSACSMSRTDMARYLARGMFQESLSVGVRERFHASKTRL